MHFYLYEIPYTNLSIHLMIELYYQLIAPSFLKLNFLSNLIDFEYL